MRKIFYGTMTFLYLIVLSKIGTGNITTEEFLMSLFSGRPSDIGTLGISLMISGIVAYKTSNEIKKITILNIISILILGGLFMKSFYEDKKIEAERNQTISKGLYILQDGLLVDKKTKQLVNETVITTNPKLKEQYMIKFENGKAITGIKFSETGEKNQMTNKDFKNIGFKH